MYEETCKRCGVTFYKPEQFKGHICTCFSAESKPHSQVRPGAGHTPTPWERNGLSLIADRTGVIATFPTPQKGGCFAVSDNIEFAHRAVNNFDSLLDALKIAEVHVSWGDCTLENVHNILRAAIAKAEAD